MSSPTYEVTAPARVSPTGKRGGVWVTLGDEQYRIPALGLGTLRDPDFALVIMTLSGIKGLPTVEQISAAVTFVHAALVRNYPALTPEDVEGMIDLANLQTILSATLGVSGFTSGGDASGEATAAAPTGTPPTSP